VIGRSSKVTKQRTYLLFIRHAIAVSRNLRVDTIVSARGKSENTFCYMHWHLRFMEKCKRRVWLSKQVEQVLRTGSSSTPS